MRKPNLFLVGAPKCGTSSMFDYLSVHPDVFASEKEPGYQWFFPDLHFQSNYSPTDTEQSYLRWYSAATSERWILDASTVYLYSEQSAERIRDFSPDARIMIMVRNPASMLYSFHGQNMFAGNEDIADFDEALAAEADRRAGRRLPPGVLLTEAVFYRRWVDYAAQIERYLNVFGRDRVRVMLFDDFVADTAAVFQDTLRFLEIDDSIQPSFGVTNSADVHTPVRAMLYRLPAARKAAAWMPAPLRKLATRLIEPFVPRLKKQGPLTDETRNRLLAELKPEIDALEALLDVDLARWRPRSAADVGKNAAQGAR